MRARQRAALAGVALMTGPLLVGQLTASPADAVPQVAEKPKPGKKGDKPDNKPNNKPDDDNKKHGPRDHDKGKPKPKPKPKDRTPPATPMLGGPGVGPGGAVSLSSTVSNSIPSRTDMMAMP